MSFKKSRFFTPLYTHSCGSFMVLYVSREQILSMVGGTKEELDRAKTRDKEEQPSDLGLDEMGKELNYIPIVDARKEKTFMCECGEIISVAEALSHYDEKTLRYFLMELPGIGTGVSITPRKPLKNRLAPKCRLLN